MTVPFAPPLGTELHYKLRSAKVRGGKQIAVTLDFFVRFERSEPGYLLTVRSVLGGLAAAQRRDPAVLMAQAPITFRLGPDGDVQSIAEEDAFWRNVDAIGDRMMAAHVPAYSGADKVALKRMLNGMRDLPEEQRVAMAARSIVPMFELAGAQMAVRERGRSRLRRSRSPCYAGSAKHQARHRRDPRGGERHKRHLRRRNAL